MIHPMKTQNGMSLVGVMVAAGIGLIITLGITSMMTDLFKSQRSIQSKDANRELTSSLRQVLTDPVACAKTFRTLGPYTPAGAYSTAVILDKNGVTVYDSLTTYQNGLVKFSKFEITNYNSGTTQADLNVYANKIGSNIGGSQMLTKIFLKLTLDAANKITGCIAVGSADSLWQLAANNSDIYYSGGNIGVGTATPLTSFDVAGAIKPGDQTQAITCNATTEGSQRYNKIVHAMEYCGFSAGLYTWTNFTGIVTHGTQTITNTSTFIIPNAGASPMLVFVQCSGGAGGGGGGMGSSNKGGGGGGQAGGSASGTFLYPPGTSVAVSIGTGGTGGAGGLFNGNNAGFSGGTGGTTIFGTLSVSGGAGGLAGGSAGINSTTGQKGFGVGGGSGGTRNGSNSGNPGNSGTASSGGGGGGSGIAIWPGGAGGAGGTGASGFCTITW